MALLFCLWGLALQTNAPLAAFILVPILAPPTFYLAWPLGQLLQQCLCRVAPRTPASLLNPQSARGVGQGPAAPASQGLDRNEGLSHPDSLTQDLHFREVHDKVTEGLACFRVHFLYTLVALYHRGNPDLSVKLADIRLRRHLFLSALLWV